MTDPIEARYRELLLLVEAWNTSTTVEQFIDKAFAVTGIKFDRRGASNWAAKLRRNGFMLHKLRPTIPKLGKRSGPQLPRDLIGKAIKHSIRTFHESCRHFEFVKKKDMVICKACGKELAK